MPTADDVIGTLRGRPRGRTVARVPTYAWVAVALLAALGVALVAGATFFRSDPSLTAPTNGWIAFSTQPGLVQAYETDTDQGGDIYLVRKGVAARLIVDRGVAKASNVCPVFWP